MARKNRGKQASRSTKSLVVSSTRCGFYATRRKKKMYQFADDPGPLILGEVCKERENKVLRKGDVTRKIWSLFSSRTNEGCSWRFEEVHPIYKYMVYMLLSLKASQ